MERFFNGYKLRYEQLNSYLLPIRAARKIKVINFFINLDDLVHKLHSPLIDKEFQCCGSSAYKQMISNVINLMGHYRNYAIKEGLIPYIYLIYTSNSVFKNNGYIKGYRDYYNKITESTVQDFMHINNTMREAFRLIPVITKYVPGLYSVNSLSIEPSVIPLYLSQQRPAQLNVMISRDEYDLQYSYLDNWIYVSPKGDNSTLVTGGTLWNYIYNKYKIESEYKLHPLLFIYAKAILGDKYRSIPKTTRVGWKTIIKYLTNVVGEDWNSASSLPLQKKAITDFIEKKNINTHSFDANVYCTSVNRQIETISSSEEMFITQQLLDVADPISVNELNKTVLQQYPLNMQFLFGVQQNNNPADRYHWQK